MELNSELTEITTGVTDLTLAILAIGISILLWRINLNDRWKAHLWCTVLSLIAIAALLGTVVHTFALPEDISQLLWKPINLALGLAVAITGLGGIYDCWGKVVAKKLLLVAIAMGGGFFLITLLIDKGFIAFVLYQAIVMSGVLIIYLILTLKKHLAGAGIIAFAISLNMVAALIQRSSLSITIFVPFDHNGLFHIIQMVAISILGWGLMVGLKRGSV